MAISPKEASARNDEQSVKRLKSAEEKLDSILKSGYHSGRGVTIDSKMIKSLVGDDHWLCEKLLDVYRKAGWKIQHHFDQRDRASWYEFSAANRNQR